MSIGYYDKNAKKYIRDTLDVNMSELYDWFLEYLPEQGTILDIGCGSGRDSKYFQEKGYEVYAHDGSVEMVRHAQRFIGKRAVVCRFDEFTPRNCFRKDLTFDGIWACSSLLHVIEEKLPEIIDNYLDYLKEDGVFSCHTSCVTGIMKKMAGGSPILLRIGCGIC